MIWPISYQVQSIRAKKRKLSFDSQLLSQTSAQQSPLCGKMGPFLFNCCWATYINYSLKYPKTHAAAFSVHKMESSFLCSNKIK